MMHHNGPRPCLFFASKVCGAFLAALILAAFQVCGFVSQIFLKNSFYFLFILKGLNDIAP
jgi:hypothetical protein